MKGEPVELAVRSSVDIECCLICWTETSYHADLAAVMVVVVVMAYRQRYNCSKKVAVSIYRTQRKRGCTCVKSHETKGVTRPQHYQAVVLYLLRVKATPTQFCYVAKVFYLALRSARPSGVLGRDVRVSPA